MPSIVSTGLSEIVSEVLSSIVSTWLYSIVSKGLVSISKKSHQSSKAKYKKFKMPIYIIWFVLIRFAKEERNSNPKSKTK